MVMMLMVIIMMMMIVIIICNWKYNQLQNRNVLKKMKKEKSQIAIN